MGTGSIPRIESIFFQANAFSIAVSKLAHPGPPEISLLIPQVVNSSLASELYLKCLILIEGGKIPREHNLAKLFDQLRDGTKQAIEGVWNAEIAKRSATLNVIDHQAGAPVTPRRLTDALAKEGGAFVSWRYAHEPGPLSNFSLSNLPAILRNHILTIRPDLDADTEIR